MHRFFLVCVYHYCLKKCCNLETFLFVRSSKCTGHITLCVCGFWILHHNSILLLKTFTIFFCCHISLCYPFKFILYHMKYIYIYILLSMNRLLYFDGNLASSTHTWFGIIIFSSFCSDLKHSHSLCQQLKVCNCYYIFQIILTFQKIYQFNQLKMTRFYKYFPQDILFTLTL